MEKVKDCPILGFYDQQRFKQFNPSDVANWFLVSDEQGKKKAAMYPTMGRRHIRLVGQNKLIFPVEPRGLFKSINFVYVVVVNRIFKVDKFFNMEEISQNKVTTFSGNIFMDFLVTLTPGTTFVGFVDGEHMYVYREDTGTFDVITDPKTPANPQYIATFGNRFVVAGNNTSEFRLTQINLGGGLYNPNEIFTIALKAVFNQAPGIIRQFGVLHNTLYIFCDYVTQLWSNAPSIFEDGETAPVEFPWRTNSTFNWDYGIADPLSLSIDFGMMVWLAQNRNGLFQVMASIGDAPKDISTQAIDVLFQKESNLGSGNPFLSTLSDGFLYVYENTIFYRLSAGQYIPTNILDHINTANSLEFNFNTKTWHRCIEKNGERNRIQKHTFLNGKHLVTLRQDSTIYEMSGEFYDNEIRNPAQIDGQALDAYIREPFRYERVTPIISEEDYSEFLTEYVEIDFVWGDRTFFNADCPFPNAVFIIDEEPAADGSPVFLIDEELGPDGTITYMITEDSNFPVIDSITYNKWFKPHVELYFSDNGGISFQPADVREFSQLGVYQWRMRWYQLGVSRNRSYKLVCVSPAPIVILGAVMLTRRISGGAY